MEEKRFLSPLGLVLCGLLVLAAGVLYLGLSLAPQGTRAIVEKSGEVVLERDLSQLTEPETFTLEGEQNIQVTVELSPQGAAVVAAAAGPGRLTRLIAMLGDAFGLVLAMTGASAVLLLVSLLSSLTAVLP